MENKAILNFDINGSIVTFDDTKFPKSRTYRNAFVKSGDSIIVDMVKAREIHRDLLRKERAPLLVDLDIIYMIAQETGTDTTDIIAEKNVLRDITDDPRIDNASSTEELEALTIDALRV